MFRLVLLMMFLGLSTLTMKAQDVAEIGKQAPNFKLSDVDGKEHSLQDFKGKYVVLEWINFDCPFVVKHYGSHNMQKLQNDFRGKDVVWLSICSSAPGKQGNFDNQEIKKRISDNKANMSAYLIDEDGKVGKLYDTRTTPHLFLISPDGTLLYQGAIDDKKSTDQADIPNSKNYLKAAYEEANSGRVIEHPSTQPYGCSVKYNK
jgi:peroxiredoxin